MIGATAVNNETEEDGEFLHRAIALGNRLFKDHPSSRKKILNREYRMPLS
jgi:hypothetical protein